VADLKVALNGLLLGERHSGVETAIEELAHGLGTLKTDLQIGLICRPQYAPQAEQMGLQPLVAPQLTTNRLGRIGFEQMLMSRWLQKGGWNLLHGPGYVLPRNWRGPAVLTVYDLIALQYPQWCKCSNVLHYRAVVPSSIHQATFVVVPSETTAKAVTALFPRAAHRLRTIPLGVSHRFQPVTDAAMLEQVRKKYHLPEHFLLYLGNLEPKKNVEALVTAFEQIAYRTQHALVLSGAGMWKCRRLLQMIEHSPVRDRIVQTGPIAEPDLPALYSAARLLIQWSWYEGAGLPPLEAMACGTPALISDGGALPELAGQAAEVVPLGPPEQLAEGIMALLEDPQRCVQIVQKGRHLADRWTWTRHALQVIALYKEALGV
jgi:glycosyltransferase involved in cell wall biosynthesis